MFPRIMILVVPWLDLAFERFGLRFVLTVDQGRDVPLRIRGLRIARLRPIPEHRGAGLDGVVPWRYRMKRVRPPRVGRGGRRTEAAP